MITDEQQKNYETFRDCFSTVLIERLSRPYTTTKKRRGRAGTRNKTTSAGNLDNNNINSNAPDQQEDLGGGAAPEELAEFVEYTAAETFEYLPAELKAVDYYGWVQTPALHTRYALPLTGADVPELMPALDPAIAESLAAYGIITNATTTEFADPSSNSGSNTQKTTRRRPRSLDKNPQGINEILAPVLTAFVTALATPPPAPISTKQAAHEAGCELCGRDWVPLTYHHLIPRFVHDKAVRRGWHRPEDLQSVAWLCGACHGFVHRFARHEELATRYYTVERLLAEEQVARWAEWAGRLRWKGR